MGHDPYFAFKPQQPGRPNHQASAPHKLRVQACPLGLFERDGWMHPYQLPLWLQMSHDERFELMVDPIVNLRGFDTARNAAVDKARKNDADFLVMLDNDCVPQISPLEIIAQSTAEMSVIGLSYGVEHDQHYYFATQNTKQYNTNFLEAEMTGGGCFIIRSEIWQRIKGPWFRWTPNDDELLSMGPGSSEDYYFCRLVRQRGFKVFTHHLPAYHYKTADLSRHAMAQLQARASGK